MAVKDINARGGVLGQKLRLEIGDDACDPKQAVAVANVRASQAGEQLSSLRPGRGSVTVTLVRVTLPVLVDTKV